MNNGKDPVNITNGTITTTAETNAQQNEGTMERSSEDAMEFKFAPYRNMIDRHS